MGLVASSVASGGSVAAPLLPIVDTHQHLWERQRLRIKWLDNAPAILNRDYVTADYLKAVEGLNVRQAVYLEVAVAEEDLQAEAKYVESLAASPDHPTAAAVIGGRCDQEGFERYVRPFADSKYIKGVRHIVQSQPRGFCLRPRFIQSVRLLGELGMSFDLTVSPTGLEDAVELCKKCPNTLIVLDHCGGADPKAFMAGQQSKSRHDAEKWKRGIAQIASAENAVCKISGIVARVPSKWDASDLAPIVNHCIDSFGPDRVMFGSDWPVCLRGASLREWVTALKEIVADRSEAFRRKLFADNAIRHYRLSAS